MDLADVDPFTEIACPNCGFKQVAPMRLGAFLLIAEMGKGGMGSVYRAFDQTLGRYVAIKVMQKQLAADKAFADNFVREARAAAALNHPNVVQIYSCSQEKGQLYIVMELVDGGRLDKMMEGGQQLDEVLTLEVGAQVAQGLLAASEIGLIHGDIKPANILFDKQQRAKVVDFGLARFAAQQHLQPGEIWGTPYYIAPEKVRSQREDHRADIYSLGATLYHVLAGEPPFDGETAKDVVLARLKNPAKGLRTVRPGLQPETADVIARTLEPDPAQRYPTYKSLLADLEEAIRVARQRHGMAPVDKSERSSLPWVIGGVAAAALVGGAIFLFSGTEEPPPPSPPARVADAGSATPEARPPAPPPDPEIVYAEQPFTDDMQARIEAAVIHWTAGDVRAYEAAMEEFFRSVPRVGVERPWVGVLQALPSWFEQRDRDTERFLRGTPDAQLRDLGDGVAHPGAMPQGVGRFIVGRMDPRALQRLTRSWPDWFKDFTLFIEAIHYLRIGWINEAERRLSEYIALRPGEVQWPYLYQPLAQQWLAPIQKWREVELQASNEPQLESRLRMLTDFRREVAQIRYLHAAVDHEIRQVEGRIRDRSAQQRRQEEQARQAQIDRDAEKIAAAAIEVRPLVQSRDFRRASSRIRQLATPLETNEGRALLQQQLQKYDRMEGLRSFLITQIQTRPAPVQISPELRGQTVSANVARIIVELSAQATMPLEWSDVTDRMFASFIEFYIADKPEQDQAERLLSLAVLLYEGGAIRPARIYADRAVGLNRRLRATVNELMPGLNQDD